MKNKKYILASICCFLCFFFSGCAGQTENNLQGITTEEVIDRLQEHSLEELISENIVYELYKNREGFYVAYDVQALPLLQNRSEFYWYPLYTKTVVLSLDRNQEINNMNKFSDLEECTNSVSLFYENTLGKEYNLLAIDYGLSGEDLSLNRTMKLFSKLSDQDLFDVDAGSELSKDIIITTDDDVVWGNREEKVRDIVIPEDGTFSYSVGLISMQPLDDFYMITEDMLVSMGYRTEKGNCDIERYPEAEKYNVVKSLAMNPNRYRAVRKVTGKWNREVEWSHFAISTSDFEHLTLYVIFLVILMLWGCAIYYRVNQKVIKQTIEISFILLLLWLVLQMIRISVFNLTLTRYAWYLSYIPIIFSIFTVLKVAVYMEKKLFQWIWKVGMIVSTLFFLLVITNDIHEWMFVFPKGILNGARKHEYALGSKILMTYLALCVILSFGLVVRKAIKNKVHISSLSICILPISVITYTYAYMSELKFYFLYWEFEPHEIGLVLFQIVLICMSWEMQLFFGVIPSNRKHRLLFENLGMKIRIVDQNGEIFIESKGKDIKASENIMRKERKINYVNVVSEVDMTEINNIQNGLKVRKEQLKQYNAFLEQENRIKRELLEIQIQNEFMQNMNQSFVYKLEQAKKRVHLVAMGDRREAEATVAYAEMLLVYIKNRGRLLLQGMNEEKLPMEAVHKAMKGTVYSANFIGLSCEYFTNVRMKMINYQSALAIYDYVEEILEEMVLKSKSVVMIFLDEIEEEVVLRMLLEGTIQEKDFRKFIAKEDHHKVEILQDEDGMHFIMRIPRQGVK